MHPVTFNKDGDVYTLSFEGFVDKVCIPSDRPKRFGKPITLYVDGIKSITYETMTKAAKELGISVQTNKFSNFLFEWELLSYLSKLIKI